MIKNQRAKASAICVALVALFFIGATWMLGEAGFFLALAVLFIGILLLGFFMLFYTLFFFFNK